MSIPRERSSSVLGGRKHLNKSLAACVNCRKKKVKCSGNYPCLYCSKRGLECNFPGVEQRRLYSVEKIQELEARLADYQSRLMNAQKAPDDQRESYEAAHVLQNLPGSGESNAHQTGSRTKENEALPTHRIVVDPDISWSQDFGYRVESLFEQRARQDEQPSYPPRISAQDLLFPRFRPRLRCRGAHDKTIPSHYPDIPGETEAYELLNAVLLYLGHVHHFFDARDFSDRLAVFCRHPQDHDRKTTIWYLEILLVLAIGKLLRGEFDENGDLPGSAWFNHAMELLPDPTELRAHGAAGIEVLALVAVYLQNLDRKEDASIYISNALRLALSHKIHRKSTSQELYRFEEVQINRLWWTVYIHDRRLTIATGSPLTIDDRSIDIPLPTDSAGFFSSLPLQSNIQVGQIQGKIYSVIYSRDPQPSDVFFASIQDIMQSLTSLAKQIREQYSTDSASSRKAVPDPALRTRISLETMLCQTLILALRPVLLQHVKAILSKGTSVAESNRTFQQLAHTCVEAARRCLELMIVLQKRRMIVPFGFFDLDTIFSASFILLLTPIVEPASDHHNQAAPKPSISEALDLLNYLVAFKNTAAMTRRRQILRVHERISSLIAQSPPTPAGSTNTIPCEPVLGDSTSPPPPTGGSLSMPTSAPWNSAVDGPSSFLVNYPDVEDYGRSNSGIIDEGSCFGILPIQFPENQQDIYTLYHTEEFALTGTDIGDFKELERHVFNFGT